ncbi:MAG: hypothetical protein RL497_1998 [Pseudomonadota bacterium]|jgi:ATP-dependent Zn protease
MNFLRLSGLIILFFLFPHLSIACTSGQNIDDATEVLEVSSTQFHLEQGDKDTKPLLTAIGNIKNTSSSCIDEIVVEAKFYNDAKELVDVISDSVYGVMIGPSKEISFKVRDMPSRASSEYKTLEIRITSAEAREKNTKNSKKSLIESLLIALAPILLFVLFFYVGMRKMQGKDSFQTKVRILMEQQTALMEIQAHAIEKIAALMESEKAGK